MQILWLPKWREASETLGNPTLDTYIHCILEARATQLLRSFATGSYRLSIVCSATFSTKQWSQVLPPSMQLNDRLRCCNQRPSVCRPYWLDRACQRARRYNWHDRIIINSSSSLIYSIFTSAILLNFSSATISIIFWLLPTVRNNLFQSRKTAPTVMNSKINSSWSLIHAGS